MLKGKKPVVPHKRKFVYECVACGKEELDERDTIGKETTEIMRLVRCEACTKKRVPLTECAKPETHALS